MSYLDKWYWRNPLPQGNPIRSIFFGNNTFVAVGDAGTILQSSPAFYTVTYDGNGNTSGTVPVDSNQYVQGASITVLGNTGSLKKVGYTFDGWNTQANGTGTHYDAGTTFLMGNQNVTLYAQWKFSQLVISNTLITTTCEKEKNHYRPMSIKGGYTSLITIPSGNVAGTTFTVSSITLNTFYLRNPCIKIDFTSNVFVTDFDETVIFQVFKRCNNLSVPVGPGWTFSSTMSLAKIFSFFVCDCDFDCDFCNNKCCTYIVVATIQ